ncbi:pilus assembly protein [Altererythrobacter sp. KTW20L]|uniref:TadE/TadG family type IV pilus assembly protein n=1 Tax=Altererythrobacter sp. KTW20L TaxID=2942210 RepID=UPI0020BE0D04|nr:TadE/TadG family type IV pilus assembly protein [Altererythrobacter sp. KTW20L]MCL6251484.1 pilus assembly protein [Altererythrobacter sp. KTW20L]
MSARRSQMKALLKALMQDRSGATIVEFAILAPIFFTFLFGTIEGSRLMWVQQTLETVAYSTSRCASVSDDCATSATQQSYAVARAAGFGITIASSDVVAQANVTCGGFPASNRVAITTSFNSVLGGLVPVFPDTLTAESCYPVLAAA